MTENSKSWGDRDIFLTKTEKKILSEWDNKNQDFTISTAVFKPIYRGIAYFIPGNVAPNIVTLVGFLCILNGHYLCFRHYDEYPTYSSVFSTILSFLYKILNGIDGIHAENLGNVSNLGHLFSRFCTNVGVLLQTMILLKVVNLHDPNIQWYVVQIVMMILFYVHLRGYKHGIVRYNNFFGAQELMFMLEIFLLLQASGILKPVYYFYDEIVFPIINSVLRLPNSVTINGIDYQSSGAFMLYIVRILYTLMFFFSLIAILRLGKRDERIHKKNLSDDKAFDMKNGVKQVPLVERINTRNSLFIIFMIRCVPGVLIYLNLMTELDEFGLVCDGLFMCMLVGDVIVSKMCAKAIHPWMIVFALVSLLKSQSIVVMIGLYDIITLFEVSAYLNLPLFSVNRNVYVDGVYDMCHYGHFKYFERALRHGTRLFVGLMNDELTAGYKRKPIMSQDERYNVVSTCRSVYKAIKDAPLCCSKELIDKYNIHVVLCSEEYNNPKDKYYKVPRKKGILRPTPRQPGISTSDLIRRIEGRYRGEIQESYKELFDEEGKLRLNFKLVEKTEEELLEEAKAKAEKEAEEKKAGEEDEGEEVEIVKEMGSKKSEEEVHIE